MRAGGDWLALLAYLHDGDAASFSTWAEAYAAACAHVADQQHEACS